MKNKGFSIAELIVVLILAGVAIAIVSPSVNRAFRRTGVRAAVDEFASTHSLARSAAVRYGRTAEMHIDASNARFWVEVDTSSTSSGVMDTVGVVKFVDANAVTITTTTDLLCFDARGLPSTQNSCDAPNATVVFSSGTRVDTVTITALGRVLR
ncbi:MAG TPA: GspH/FimT family pseudopilin [Gemmatimonadota bacterium]|nr:GspH/FimT family pseudopilin [Gemmatimonadota bacterium]